MAALWRVELSGSDCWTLRRSGSEHAVSASVPGDVVSDVVRAKKADEPLLGRREETTLATLLRGESWLYERKFEFPEEHLRVPRLVLVCEGTRAVLQEAFVHLLFLNKFTGLDTACAVTVNGKVVGKADNSFARHCFDIRSTLRGGANVLTVQFENAADVCARRAAARPADASPLAAWEYAPHIGNAYRQLLRKPACHFGWDWGPYLPSCGISGAVYVVAHETPLVSAVTPLQLWDGGSLRIRLRVHFEAGAPGFRLDAEAAIPALEAYAVTRGVQAGAVAGAEGTAEVLLDVGAVDAEALWWPAGYGEQPLHKLSVVLRDSETGVPFFERDLQIGLRSVAVDTAGGAFAFVVNGVRVYAKGADWVPVDLFRGRITPERTVALLEWCRHAHMNCVRVWGGGDYESDTFYDYCDAHGILVWQDLAFACACYPADADFLDSVRREVRWQARRLAGRTSLVLWCGNNEIEEGMPFDCQRSPLHRSEYLALFRDTIPPILKEKDGTRLYWRSSPSRGIVDGDFDEKAGDASEGDCHYWGVWHGSLDISRYLSLNPRFISEFGFQSLPPLDVRHSDSVTSLIDLRSGRQLLEKALEIQAGSPVYEKGLESPELVFRQRSGRGNEKLAKALALYFPPPLGGAARLGSEAFLTQCLQALALGPALEHLRCCQPRCAGSLYWQLNDVWAAPSWSTLAYPARPKLAHYAARRAYAPVALSAAARPEGGIDVWLASDLPAALPGRLKARVFRWAASTPLAAQVVQTSAPARGCARVLEVDLPGPDPRDFALLLSFRPDATGDGDSDGAATALRCPDAFFFPCALRNARVPSGAAPRVRVGAVGADGAVSVSAVGGVCPFVWLDDGGAGGRFDDNAFALAPSRKPRCVRYTAPPGCRSPPAVTATCLWDHCALPLPS